ncbi:MAG: efflux RND transporter periplasmic adaptor subunit [Planctomycetes bacterium]|nr:efflux RND transporter periplasmic adaptor subunit [Planctomycetota bacterium]
MSTAAPASDLERRKLVRLRRRSDLTIVPQRYEGRMYYVVKDPVNLRYYRFKEQEHYLLMLFDGRVTLDSAQKAFEDRFRPERLKLEDLEQFGQQLLTMGLVQHDTPQAGKLLFEHRSKRIRMEWMQTLTNILYIKIPIFDPEKLLGRMLPWLWWMFTRAFLIASFAFMASAALLVLTHFETFHERLPSFESYFNFKNMIYLWIALGVVKVIHEFGHGLSCKAFGGEVHEMGFLLLCLSPAMYCNVSDAWRLPNKWHRILISFAGIYVELMIAAAATFIWWNTESTPFVNNLCLHLMVVCSVSTVVFNGNPLMRYDGYYVLSDWMEIPNLRDRANKYLQKLAMEYCLGIEVQPEGYMELHRRILFVIFAVISYVYRWVVTFVILKFMATFLKPYKLEVISELLALGALGSMIGWPVYRLIKNVSKRGRLPDMKPIRVSITACCVAVVLFVIFFVPLPITRIYQSGVVQVQPTEITQIAVEVPGILKMVHVREGQFVKKGKVLAEFAPLEEMESQKELAMAQMAIKDGVIKTCDELISKEQDLAQRDRLREQRAKADSEHRQAVDRYKQIVKQQEKLTLRAPRDGVVMGLPKIDEIDKRWDKEQNSVFCSVGDKSKLRILVPLAPDDYRLLEENYDKSTKQHPLEATIRVQGHGAKLWEGRISQLPKSDAKEIPPQLSNKMGGPLAIKPTGDPNKLTPQSQVFLVGIDLVEPDDSIAINTGAQVKIHCEYRSIAWWAYRKVSSTFDLGLLW